jgi:glutathione S-transferase
MLTVHHLGISQSDRIVWLCEELEIPYTLIRYERDPVTKFAPPAYRALHPFGTAPVISDGDRVLGESGAIMEYIIAKYGAGRLAVKVDEPEFADYLFWFHFANGSLMPSSMIDLVAQRVEIAPSGAELIRALRHRSERAFDLIERRLGESQYLAGNRFTAADIINFFPMTTMRVFAPRDLSGSPNTRAYIKRIAVRPAYRRAMEKADPGFTPPLE